MNSQSFVLPRAQAGLRFYKRLREQLIAGVISLVLAFSLVSHWLGQDVLHVFVVSGQTEECYINIDTGNGFQLDRVPGSMLFPSQANGSGEARVNFPVPPHLRALRLYPGERPGSLTITRICLQRLVGATRCIDGAELTGTVGDARNLQLEASGSGLQVQRTGVGSSFAIGNGTIEKLEPLPASVFLTEAGLFTCAAVFFYLFFAALVRPLFAWWNISAWWTFVFACLVRGIFFTLYRPGTVSDSDLFLRYLNVYIFNLPGIRGLVYPSFLTLFGKSLPLICAAQLTLGACGAVIVFLLLRSSGKGSRWNIFWAIAATSIPTLLAMEALVLSESLSLFLLLAGLFMLRWLQLHPASLVSAAGLGCCTALLYHTKPQFGFVMLPIAWVVWMLRGSAARRMTAFLTPVAALWFFAVAITNSAANFRGVSSTLG